MMWDFIAKIAAAIISAAGGIISSYIYYRLKFKDDNEEGRRDEEDLGDHIEYAKKVDKELKTILDTIEADRVWIAQFHNGKQYYPPNSGNSMKKLSVTHEVTSAGVSKERNTFSDMLVSFFSEMVLDVSEHDHIRYLASENEESPNEVDVLFRQRGARAMDLCSMKNLDEKLVGVLGVDHMREVPELSEDKIDYLNKKANLLGGLLYYGDIEERIKEQQQ